VENQYGLSMILYGRSKQGKSFCADTTPGPRVVLDAEMGSRFTPSRKIVWDPITQAPPVDDGTWDTAIVYVRQYATVSKAFEWLNSGKHPFRSAVLDSISEIQQRAVDDIAGTNQMKTTDWGDLLRRVSELVRRFRDLTTNPLKPLDAVVMIAMARDVEGHTRPHVQGSLATTLPYYVDVCAYLQVVPGDDGITPVRRLFVGPTPGYETGERVGGRLGSYIDNPNITEMLAAIRDGDNTNVNTQITSITTEN